MTRRTHVIHSFNIIVKDKCGESVSHRESVLNVDVEPRSFGKSFQSKNEPRVQNVLLRRNRDIRLVNVAYINYHGRLILKIQSRSDFTCDLNEWHSLRVCLECSEK